MREVVKQQFWIVDVLYDDATVEKIWKKHHVTYEQACQAVQLGSYESARWREDLTRGRRLFVIGKTDAGSRLLVILEPVDMNDGRWRLKSAWEIKS